MSRLLFCCPAIKTHPLLFLHPRRACSPKGKVMAVQHVAAHKSTSRICTTRSLTFFKSATALALVPFAYSPTKRRRARSRLAKAPDLTRLPDCMFA